MCCDHVGWTHPRHDPGNDESEFVYWVLGAISGVNPFIVFADDGLHEGDFWRDKFELIWLESDVEMSRHLEDGEGAWDPRVDEGDWLARGDSEGGGS